MKFSKGEIQNINKRLLSGVLSLTLMTVPLFGCNGTELKYEKNSQGEMVCVSNIKHSYIEKYKVVVFGINNNQLFYITKVVDGKNDHYYEEYYNIFGGELIYSSNKESSLKIIKEEELINYLVLYDKVQQEYSEEDLKEILEQIKVDYKKETDKRLVK